MMAEVNITTDKEVAVERVDNAWRWRTIDFSPKRTMLSKEQFVYGNLTSLS